VLPLCVQRVRGIPLLSLPGYYLPFRGLPLRADAATPAATSAVQALTSTGGGIALRIGPLEAGCATHRAMVDALRTAGWSILEIPRGELVAVDLPSSIDAYRTQIRGRAKKADYFLRRMRKDGEVRIELRTQLSREQTATLLDHLEHIESHSWVAHSGEPRYLGERNRTFWTDLLARPEFRRAFRTWILSRNETPVSFCMTLDAGPVRYQLVNGYAEDVGRYSTGHILFQAMIHDAIHCGIARLNFGQGDPGHKSEWGARATTSLTDVVALRPGLFGRTVALGFRLLTGLRQKAARKNSAPS